MAKLTTLADDALIALDTLQGRAADLVSPTVRLGVTGLSRAGKTVFISALVHNLIHGGRLPMFEAYRSGRIARAFLQEQPDDNVPRFQYEEHIHELVQERLWPQSTRQISELRLTIEFESASRMSRLLSRGRLHLDIVDYPGEWLLDLPLLGQSYEDFSRNALELAELPARADLARDWIQLARNAQSRTPAEEAEAQLLAAAFTRYLRACKDDSRALSTLPPGRFLMPGDLEGSPALTFSPLPEPESPARAGSLYAMMKRRFESYKSYVVKPFFREHIARLDRQIILVDALQALNAGAAATSDLQRALNEIMACFRHGSSNLLTGLFTRRIDRILVAATKADHLHHESHDRLQEIVRALVGKALSEANFSGAKVETIAMAAVRATREGSVMRSGESLPVIVGTPMEGETIAGETFDGRTETAIFPGDLPEAAKVLQQVPDEGFPQLRFVRFRPPELERTAEGFALSLPHIRLDRALEFLMGDRLK